MNRKEKLALYEALATEQSLILKGKATAYTSMNGNMFSFLAPDGTLAFRLSKEDQVAFELEHGPSEVRQYNSVMRGYVGISDDLLSDTEKLKSVFEQCVKNAKSLKPKPMMSPKIPPEVKGT